MPVDRQHHLDSLRRAMRCRDGDERADIYGAAMTAGLEAAVPWLVPEAAGDDRLALAMFMRAFPRPAWLPTLAAWQADADLHVRAAVVAALALQPPTDDAAAIFDAALDDPAALVRVRAVRAMADSGAGRWRGLLERACADEDKAVRERARAALN